MHAVQFVYHEPKSFDVEIDLDFVNMIPGMTNAVCVTDVCHVIFQRKTLEKKLEESRQQLTEIKSTWSDRISHLEEQISHLNQKIVEDSEELAQSQKLTETVRENNKHR